jgi:hypothetical protein
MAIGPISPFANNVGMSVLCRRCIRYGAGSFFQRLEDIPPRSTTSRPRIAEGGEIIIGIEHNRRYSEQRRLLAAVRRGKQALESIH